MNSHVSHENPAHHPSPWVVVAAVTLVAVAVFTIGFYLLLIGSAKLPGQLVRLSLTIALAYFLIQGRSWARWVTVCLLILAVLMTLPTLFTTIASANMLGFTFLAGLTMTYLLVGGTLLFAPGVSAHFATKSETAERRT